MLHEFHIGEGGPLRRLETAARLTSLPRQIVAALAITWLPLVVLGLATERLTGRTESIIRDVSVHVRLLVATPIFLLLDRVFLLACRNNLEQLVAEGFVPIADESRFERLVRGATRLADAVLPEVVLASLALVVGVAALLGWAPMGGLTRGDAVSASQVWYALVDWPFFQFLLWRSLWRWAIWARVLVGLSRIDLALVATHPDRRGGIGFLSQPSVDYCAMLLFAVSSVLTAEWDARFTFATFFEPLVLAFAVFGVLVAFGPLIFFAPRLERTRRAGLVESARVATAFGRRLRAQSLETRDLESRLRSDPEPLAHMTQIHRNTVEHLVPLLIYKRDLVLLVIATFSPVVPMMMMHIPHEEWVVLVKLFTGGRLGH